MIRRRHFLGAGLSLAGTAILHVPPAGSAVAGRAKPGTPGWPIDADWQRLKRAVGGRLSPVALPDFNDSGVRALLRDPFYIGDQPGLTQSSGWLDAWRSAPSAYVVAAESAADVAAAVRFARAHNLRLVVKGGGHSYLGASNAPDSLLDLDAADERHHRPRRLHAARFRRCRRCRPCRQARAASGCMPTRR